MATDREMDRVSGLTHVRAVAMFREILKDEPQADDADIQASVINGLNAAVCTLMWNGREDHSTPDTIADAIRFAAWDLLRQMHLREHN